MANIKIYARVCPRGDRYKDATIGSNDIDIRLADYIRDSRSSPYRSLISSVNHNFKFNHVFDDKVAQADVFDTAARGIVDGKFTLLPF